jgi:monoamine oxidase
MSTFESRSGSELEGELREEELLSETGQEPELAYEEFEEIRASRMVDPAKVDCAKFNRSLPIFRAIGTTDPVGLLETVCRRAVVMLDNTVAELTRIRRRVLSGEPPAFPLINDLLGWSLQTRMLMRASDPKAWTGKGPRTVEQILRWLTNIRKAIASGDLWYTCLAAGCSPTMRAFVFTGRFRIHLCRRFWRPKPGISTATHLEYQAQTIIHEVSHIYYDTEDRGRGPGAAHCIAQFVADANGSPIRREIVGRCGPREPTLSRDTEEELVSDVLETPALELDGGPWTRIAPPSRSSSTRKEPYVPPPICRKQQLEKTEVVVVGGGLAGLMAAMTLRQNGVKVTLFEARPREQVGGRVLSSTTFSKGRIIEEGAELIGSFHTTWLGLARQFGLSVISRMESELYERAGLDVKFRLLGKNLPKKRLIELAKAMDVVLKRIADDADKYIEDASEPWREPNAKLNKLEDLDNTSVADKLKDFGVPPPPDDLFEFIKIKLVNDEVAPLETMSYLGLLCKVKAGQGLRFGDDPDEPLNPDEVRRKKDRYWNELEIFRCAEGCQTLAKSIAESIRSVDKMLPPVEIRFGRAVTHIELSNRGARVGHKDVIDPVKGILTPGKPTFTSCNYVILASPPSAWQKHGVNVPQLTITADDGRRVTPVDLFGKKAIGTIGMFPAVKFFSKMNERFWIKQKAAPYGGATELGQVWEGTDNQTRVAGQGIVLSVFAGPILKGGRTPMPVKFREELELLFPGYENSRLKTEPPSTRFSDWPEKPFIKTGYFSPKPKEISEIAWMFNRKWSRIKGKPLHDRLFFAGEHTDMGFFGYMEGALRSGKRAAEEVMREACGQPEQAVLTKSIVA